MTKEEKKAKQLEKKLKRKEQSKGLFAEFKKFISKGNAVDMAIGATVGAAFTAIVSSLTNNIFKPIISWFICLVSGNKSITGVYTFLVTVKDETTGDIDLSQSVYIDWSAVLNALLNFILTALILFALLKLFVYLTKKANQIKAAAVEDYYKKHPEERPAPVAPEKPKPTTEELLEAILVEMKKKNGEENKEGEEKK